MEKQEKYCVETSSCLELYEAIGLDKSGYQVNSFSYYSMKTYVVDTH